MNFNNIMFVFISFAYCMPSENGMERKRRVVRNAVTNPNLLWPNGLVYYQFDTNFRKLLYIVLFDFQTYIHNFNRTMGKRWDKQNFGSTPKRDVHQILWRGEWRGTLHSAYQDSKHVFFTRRLYTLRWPATRIRRWVH